MLNEKMKYIHSIIIVLRKKRKHQYVYKKWLFLNYEIISDYFKKKLLKYFPKLSCITAIIMRGKI